MALTMLAYVFVHDANEDADRRQYRVCLGAFHDALAFSPPDGFVRSWAWQVEAGPLGHAFEDWYLVEDWAALGSLNEAAVTGSRKAPHDEIASLAGEGVGAIYGLARGEPSTSASHRLRVGKPLDVPYPEFEAALYEAVGSAATVWKRQMVLGSDLEFLVDCAARPADAILGQAADISALHLVHEIQVVHRDR